MYAYISELISALLVDRLQQNLCHKTSMKIMELNTRTQIQYYPLDHGVYKFYKQRKIIIV
jgi:hypothetical protein